MEGEWTGAKMKTKIYFILIKSSPHRKISLQYLTFWHQGDQGYNVITKDDLYLSLWIINKQVKCKTALAVFTYTRHSVYVTSTSSNPCVPTNLYRMHLLNILKLNYLH